jgi:hypothetical protein
MSPEDEPTTVTRRAHRVVGGLGHGGNDVTVNRGDQRRHCGLDVALAEVFNGQREFRLN